MRFRRDVGKGHCGKEFCISCEHASGAAGLRREIPSFIVAEYPKRSNKRFIGLATLQEHFMIVRALKTGVSENKLAKVLERRHKAHQASSDIARGHMSPSRQDADVEFSPIRRTIQLL